MTVAYSLEQGLLDFYQTMRDQAETEAAKRTFSILAQVEVKHQESILLLYQKLTAADINKEDFEKNIVMQKAEGGLTTEEYLKRFEPAPKKIEQVLSAAISIEAQALDLYMRAADLLTADSKKLLTQLADEEQAHMNMLAELFEEETK